eukprot:2857233-Prymnesium_polylepis.1
MAACERVTARLCIRRSCAERASSHAGESTIVPLAAAALQLTSMRPQLLASLSTLVPHALLAA